MQLTEPQRTRLIALVQSRYPGWTSFDDPSLLKNEIGYKRKASQKAKAQLEEGALRDLLAKGDFEAVMTRIDTASKGNNLLWRSIPKESDVNILGAAGLDRASFCNAFVDLLYGEGASPDRLERYLAYVASSKLPSKWPFPTYYLFLLFPDTELFIKPTPIGSFIQQLGFPDLLSDKPSAASYAQLRDMANACRDALSEFKPRDLIDIQSAIWVAANADDTTGAHATNDHERSDHPRRRYWTLAPGENARLWDDFKTHGIAAIGWDFLGDLKKYKSQEEIAAAIQAQRGGTEYPINDSLACHEFANEMQIGDQVLIKQGLDTILALGEVTSDYSFDPARDEYRHVRHMRWIAEGKWKLPTEHKLSVKTLTEATSYTSFLRYILPLVTGASKGASVSSLDAALTPRAFDLLALLTAAPTVATYQAHKSEYQDLVEDPLRSLMTSVASVLRPEILVAMETEKKVMARFLKNDYGRGGAWDYLWWAFYPKGGKRTEDAQLAFWVNREVARFGFYLGDYASEQRVRFLRNYAKHGNRLKQHLEESETSLSLVFGSYEERAKGVSLATWAKDPDEEGIAAAVVVPREQLLATKGTDLIHQIKECFEALFPFVLLATNEDPLPALDKYLGEEEPDIQEVYSLETCAAETHMPLSRLEQWVGAIERKGQAVIFGPPGTGKTFLAEKLAKHLVSGADGVVDLVQFHPAYAYEDFVQGIRPEVSPTGTLTYPLKPGRLLDFARKAAQSSGRCVLIIDEINRANLSRVFGELMYLLEYRDRDIPLAGGGLFRMPGNIRIIGTMNTADRSIALVDHALRRRFAFLPLYPDFDLLAEYQQARGVDAGGLIGVLREVNQLLGDPGYGLGVSYFLIPDLKGSLQSIWQMEIEPYLEEHFFDRKQQLDQYRWDQIAGRLLA